MNKKIITLLFIIFTPLVFSKTSDSKIKAQIYKKTITGHHALSYSVVKKVLFSTVENKDGIVCSVYTPSQCAKRYYKQPPKSLTKDNSHFKLNIEHTWPQSKGAKELPANSDMHHLFVTSKESNSKRANLPFCDVVYDFWQKDGSAKGIDDSAQDCFEPQDKHKGNVARAMFYFSIRYKLPIDKEQERVFRSWHKLDPVDENEVKRNLLIKKYQGNVNPFIIEESLVSEVKDF